MKNKIGIKVLNIILALAMLFGNAPQAQALRPPAGRLRGADRGYITAIQHDRVNEFIKEIQAYADKFNRPDLEVEFGVKGTIRIQVVPGLYKATGVKGHYGITYNIIYIDEDALNGKDGKQYIAHELFELKGIITLAANSGWEITQLIEWLDKTGNPDEIKQVLLSIHLLAPIVPDGAEEFIPEPKRYAQEIAVINTIKRVAPFLSLIAHNAAGTKVELRRLVGQGLRFDLINEDRIERNDSSDFDHNSYIQYSRGWYRPLEFLMDYRSEKYSSTSSPIVFLVNSSVEQIEDVLLRETGLHYAMRPARGAADAQTPDNGGAATVEESFARWDAAVKKFSSVEELLKQPELSSQLAELVENTVFNATNAGLVGLLEKTKDNAYGVIAFDAEVLRNITAMPLLRLIRENMPPDGIKIAVWGVQDESMRKELREAGVFTFTTVNGLAWFNQHRQQVILITPGLQSQEKAFADQAFRDAYAYQLINIPHIEDESNIHLLTAVLMNAVARLSRTGRATEDAFKKSLEWNLANERLDISEEARAALANIEDSLITVLPATVTNAKMLEMIKFYATQK